MWRPRRRLLRPIEDTVRHLRNGGLTTSCKPHANFLEHSDGVELRLNPLFAFQLLRLREAVPQPATPLTDIARFVNSKSITKAAEQLVLTLDEAPKYS